MMGSARAPDKGGGPGFGGESVAEEASEFRTVAKVGDVPEGGGIPVEVDDRAIAIFLDGGTYYALDDQCPHQGAPLCDGVVGEKTVTCTWHG